MKASSIKSELESYASTVNEFILRSIDGKPKELYQASSHLIRHGTATVHRSFGMPLAILAGDILFSKAFELLYNSRSVGISDRAITEMVGRLSTTCTVICEGQAIDVGNASSSKFPSDKQYIEMIGKKTAALFEVSCAFGALSAPNSSDQDVRNLSSFGKNIGIAFQLVDDLIGVVGDPKLTGKAAGNDIREGKKTYPILLAIKSAKGEEKDRILKVFGAKDRASATDIREAVRVISDIGIEQGVRDAAREYMNKALRSIEGYGDSDAKRLLKFSADFVVGRSL